MARFLTREWLDEVLAAGGDGAGHEGASARIQAVVSGGPDGDVKCSVVIEDGRFVEAVLGDLAGAETTMTTDYATAVEIGRGDLDVNTAFMQGRVKVAGDMGGLMRVLPLTRTAGYESGQERIRAATEY